MTRASIEKRALHRRAWIAGSSPAMTICVRSRDMERAMDTRDLHDKGLKLRREMFGRDAVEQRRNAFGAFGEPLQNMINAYAYGDVWSRSALPLKTKSLAAIAMTAAIGRANELRVHVNGALTNGCTAEEIRDILLLVALYCGIPAAIEGHRIALDVLRERGAA